MPDSPHTLTLAQQLARDMLNWHRPSGTVADKIGSCTVLTNAAGQYTPRHFDIHQHPDHSDIPAVGSRWHGAPPHSPVLVVSREAQLLRNTVAITAAVTQVAALFVIDHIVAAHPHWLALGDLASDPAYRHHHERALGGALLSEAARRLYCQRTAVALLTGAVYEPLYRADRVVAKLRGWEVALTWLHAQMISTPLLIERLELWNRLCRHQRERDLPLPDTPVTGVTFGMTGH